MCGWDDSYGWLCCVMPVFEYHTQQEGGCEEMQRSFCDCVLKRQIILLLMYKQKTQMTIKVTLNHP